MGVRRERPPAERPHATIRLRLPDGTVREMPGEDRGPGGSELCCFCGGGFDSEGGAIRLSAQWHEGAEEHTQSWSAHRACLAARIHVSAAGTGPFFSG